MSALRDITRALALTLPPFAGVVWGLLPLVEAVVIP